MSADGKMRAVVFETFGPPDVLHVVDHPKPVRKPGEVLVKLDATGVNPIDFKIRKGEMLRFLVKLPKVPGGDVAGSVVESDEGSAFSPGTHVFSLTDGFKPTTPHGCYAEYVSIPEAHVARAPANISMVEAAGLPLVSLTAWQALDQCAGLSAGERVLIHAGAGGVGSVAIQLAKARGLHVITTCSSRNLELVRSLGADEAVDYTAQRFEECIQPVDAVIDTIGGDVEVRSLRLLKRSGTFVSVLNSGWTKHGMAVGSLLILWHFAKGRLAAMLRLGPRYQVQSVTPNGQQLAEVARLVESGAVRPLVDRVLPLEKAAEAHAYLEQGHARGKVVLAVSEATEAAVKK